MLYSGFGVISTEGGHPYQVCRPHSLIESGLFEMILCLSKSEVRLRCHVQDDTLVGTSDIHIAHIISSCYRSVFLMQA